MIQEFRVGPHKLIFDLQPEQFMSDHNLMWYANHHIYPEPEVVAVMLRALKPGDCAVDAGANVGFFTVLMSKIVGPEGMIVAVEPDIINVRKLRKNLDINSINNVIVHECAIGTTEGRAFLSRPEDNGQCSLHGPVDEEQPQVLVLPLTELFGAHGRPRLLKLDIEGSEVDALLGCTFDFPVIVAEINEKALTRAGRSSKDLFRLMRDRGYRRYQLHADGSMPSHIDSYQEVKLTRENTNMLFAPRDYVAKNLWPEVEL